MLRKIFYAGMLSTFFLLGGCADHPIVEPKTPLYERTGEIRTTKGYSALRLRVQNASLVDSVLVGPGGNTRFFVSHIQQSQLIVIQPQGAVLGTNLKFRVFAKNGSDVKSVDLSFLEGADSTGTSELPHGSVVWFP